MYNYEGKKFASVLELHNHFVSEKKIQPNLLTFSSLIKDEDFRNLFGIKVKEDVPKKLRIKFTYDIDIKLDNEEWREQVDSMLGYIDDDIQDTLCAYGAQIQLNDITAKSIDE